MKEHGSVSTNPILPLLSILHQIHFNTIGGKNKLISHLME